MSFLKADQIIASEDIPYRDVPVPEWSTDKDNPDMVRVVGLDGSEASKFGKRMVKLDQKGNVKELQMDNFLADLLVLTLTNDKFERIFTKDQVEALGKKSAAVLKRLSDIAMELSGLSENSVEDAEKN